MKEKIETLREDLNEFLHEEYEKIQEYIKNDLDELSSVESIKGFFKAQREEFLEETSRRRGTKVTFITKKKQKTILKAIESLL